MNQETQPRSRLASLDQFRGYTVAGMFLVNFIGAFQAAPYLFKHHLVFCSYADTIMPQFFFAVGFAMRLSFGRRNAAEGLASAYRHAVLRSLGLMLIAILWYGGRPQLPDGIRFEWESFRSIGVWGAIWKQLKVDWFQTLLHIAVTSVWILPVIRASARVRLAYLVASACLHMILNYWFYFDWHNNAPRGIDGGPLGFLTWSIPTLAGTLVCDWVGEYQSNRSTSRKVVTQMLVWSVIFCSVGWILSCGTRWYDVAEDAVSKDETPLPVLSSNPVFPPKESFQRWLTDLRAGRWNQVLAESPFVPPPHARDLITVDGRSAEKDFSSRYRPWNYWMMSQQCGSISYLTFSAGVSIAVFLLFFLLADLWSIRIGVFRTLGVNALFGYFIHSIVDGTVKTFMPEDISTFAMWVGFACYFGLCWLVLRYLEQKKLFLKL